MSEGGDDRALLARHAAGDRQAFAVLVERHRDRLWRVALRTLGDPEDAADAVQDALVSAYRAAASYRAEAAVTTWLHRIVVNACLDLARKRTSRPTQPMDEAHPEPVDVGAAAAYDDSDTATAVMSALRRLPADHAAAVVLVDIEGFPVREVADILGVPEGTVKSRCARSRARLAEMLSELAPRAARNLDPSPAVEQPDNASPRSGDHAP